jgi:D-threonate/D-erythronate kinase
VTALTTIADDLTGACDVGAELAAAGHRVRVSVEAGVVLPPADGCIPIVNTQSRALDPGRAYARVRDALSTRRAPLVLKKIDTALRGHLGAEIDGALDALAAPVFVLAAIPAAGRVTRDGCQWFGGRLLATTEFASDPEGPGRESSIPAVLARESERRASVIGRDVVAAGRLAATVTSARTDGVEVFVVDAESDDDVRAAVAAILALPRPLCLAGSIALAAALAPHLEASAVSTVEPDAGVPLPALIVSGSLHSRAREQVGAVVAAGLATALPMADGGDTATRGMVLAVRRALAAGRSIVVAPAAPVGVPTADALRATERRLAELVAAVAQEGPIPTLIAIGGETSYAVLTRLGASALAIDGRIAPLIARGAILSGAAAGSILITKGGSGGDADALVRLLAGSRIGARVTA